MKRKYTVYLFYGSMIVLFVLVGMLFFFLILSTPNAFGATTTAASNTTSNNSIQCIQNIHDKKMTHVSHMVVIFAMKMESVTQKDLTAGTTRAL